MPDPKPPEGYETWLDYAVGCLDIVCQPNRRMHEFVEAARAELAALRADAKNWRAVQPAIQMIGQAFVRDNMMSLYRKDDDHAK